MGNNQNLLSNMTIVKHPYNYIFAGNTCFNITEGNTSHDYEVAICNDDSNLYFVRVKNELNSKYEYAGCFRVSDDGEIKYYRGNRGKFDVNDEEIVYLMDCIKGSNSNLVVNRNRVTNCVCCGKEIALPELMSVGVCSKCFNIFKSAKLKTNPNWSIPKGLKISDISQVLHPNNLDYDNSTNNIPTVTGNVKKTFIGNSSYSKRDTELVSMAEDLLNKTWGVYLDDNGNTTQHVYVYSKNETLIPPVEDVSDCSEPLKLDADGFMDIPVGSSDADILEKLFS